MDTPNRTPESTPKGTPLAKSVDCVASSTSGRAQATPMPARLIFNPATPLVIRLELGSSGREQPEWELCRDLLDEGLDRPTTLPAGLGDVRVSTEAHDVSPWRNEGGEVRVELSNDKDEYLALWFPVRQVREFLAASFWMVPRDAEMDGVDLDAVIRSLIGGRS